MPTPRIIATRVLAYEEAMAQLHARYPDDSEAAIYYALALNVAALPTDKTYAKQLKAAEILEAEVVRQPDHPGVVHYLIHTYDYPPLADAGSRRPIATPSSPPRRRTRCTCPRTSSRGSATGIARSRPTSRSAEVARAGKEMSGELHARDYMVYAYLQTGRDEAARQAIAEASSSPARNRPARPGRSRWPRCRRGSPWSAAPGRRRRTSRHGRASSPLPMR